MQRCKMLELVGRVHRGRDGGGRRSRWSRWSRLSVLLRRWSGSFSLLLLLVPMVCDRSSGDYRAAPGPSPESHFSTPSAWASIISTGDWIGITQNG